MEKLQENFIKLSEFQEGEKRVKAMLIKYENNMEKYLAPWMAFSKDAKHVYPSKDYCLLLMIIFHTIRFKCSH